MYEISLKTGRFCSECGKELGYLDPTHKQYYKGDPERVNSYFSTSPHSSNEYRKKCFDCFVSRFGKLPPRQNILSEGLDWLLGIDTSERRKSNVVTLSRMIERYGDIEGSKKYEEYRTKQSVKNTFEFKRDLYGWSQEDFKQYNKSRSVTLENCIRRHGETEGRTVFNTYCEKQAYAGVSLEYFQERYGKELGEAEYNRINALKANTLENYVNRYGWEDGPRLFKEYVESRPTIFFSKLGLEFCEIVSTMIDDECRFGESEFGIYDKVMGRYYKYDFCIPNKRKIIEFNGDYWHADPNRYGPNDLIGRGEKRRASEIWESDEQKLACARTEGYDILVVWESEFLNDRERTLIKCVEFLKK